MRVITWNCNMAFRKKASLVTRLKPDIVIVPECETLDRLGDEWISDPQSGLWIGDNQNKGLGVLSYSGLRIKIHLLYDPTIRYVMPIVAEKDGQTTVVLAVWAMNDTENREDRYIGRIWKAINLYEKLLREERVIIAGDFNWNVIWDQSSTLVGTLAKVVEFLSERGIQSIYHTFHNERFGEESQATLFMYRKEERPYHIDYIFGSAPFVENAQSITVGAFGYWSEHSDHMPLIADFSV